MITTNENSDDVNSPEEELNRKAARKMIESIFVGELRELLHHYELAIQNNNWLMTGGDVEYNKQLAVDSARNLIYIDEVKKKLEEYGVIINESTIFNTDFIED